MMSRNQGESGNQLYEMHCRKSKIGKDKNRKTDEEGHLLFLLLSFIISIAEHIEDATNSMRGLKNNIHSNP